MPSASEFRAAAQTISDVCSELNSLMSDLDDVKVGSGLVGRTLALTKVEDGVEEARGRVTGCSTSLSGVCDDLNWRADQCDAYAARLADWQAAMQAFEANGGTGPAPERPEPPYPWVSA